MCMYIYIYVDTYMYIMYYLLILTTQSFALNPRDKRCPKFLPMCFPSGVVVRFRSVCLSDVFMTSAATGVCEETLLRRRIYVGK